MKRPADTPQRLVKAPADVALLASAPLLPTELGAAARRAAEEILVEGEAENTVRSYASAMRYWCAWAQLRYQTPLTLPVAPAVVLQFLVDHLARGPAEAPKHELPQELDQLLVRSGFKGKPGPLKMSTVLHRVSVLSKLHQLRDLPNPCEQPEVRHLLSRAKRAAAKRGETVHKKTAATREPLEAMVATCDGSLEGLRDRALILFAWASGGRRRSEVASASVEQLSRHADGSFSFRLGRSKTNQDGSAALPDKPLSGVAADALRAWLTASGVTEGAIFRRLWKSRVGPGLSPASVAQVIRKRARLAGLDGDWAGHSLRSGFITEAGRRSIAIGDVMAMTEHRKVDTVMGYYRAANLAQQAITKLLD